MRWHQSQMLLQNILAGIFFFFSIFYFKYTYIFLFSFPFSQGFKKKKDNYPAPSHENERAKTLSKWKTNKRENSSSLCLERNLLFTEPLHLFNQLLIFGLSQETLSLSHAFFSLLSAITFTLWIFQDLWQKTDEWSK